MSKKGKKINSLSNWTRYPLLLLIFGTLYPIGVWGQVAFSRYIGDLEAIEEGFRLDIFNSSPTTVEISEHFIITRQFIAQIPSNTYLRPLQSLSIGSQKWGENSLSFEEIRIIQKETEGADIGNFCVLFSSDFALLDAFYFSPNHQVDFLPRQESISLSGDVNSILMIPDESDRRWKHLQTGEGKIDPALAFVQINGDWRISSRSKNLIPATSFASCDAQFFADQVRVQWKVLDEKECYNYLIERSEDGTYFKQIGIVPALGQAGEYLYQFEDVNILSDVRYYYRIRNVDKFGFTLISPIASVQTGRTSDRFFIQLLDIGKSINIRFVSTLKQEVRIKLMDEEFREIDILFFGEVESGKDNLLEYLNQLAIGKYFLVAQTERQRIYEEVIIER